MLKENQFQIEKSSSFKTRLTFLVNTWDDSFEHDIQVSCSEDIEEIMEAYFKKDWKTLFSEFGEKDYYWIKDICDVSFDGIYITANEEDKGHVYLMLHSSQRVTVSVNLELMNDKNANKINAIRDILNN